MNWDRAAAAVMKGVGSEPMVTAFIVPALKAGALDSVWVCLGGPRPAQPLLIQDFKWWMDRRCPPFVAGGRASDMAAGLSHQAIAAFCNRPAAHST